MVLGLHIIVQPESYYYRRGHFVHIFLSHHSVAYIMKSRMNTYREDEG